jgi:glycosyltransferase involved in cell wall biosynthesis
MLNGIPVVASDLPAVREVCGDDGALFFPVGDVEQAARAVNDVAGNASQYAELAERGHERVTTLLPEKIAEEFRNLYR